VAAAQVACDRDGEARNRFNIKMTSDQSKLEQFLNSLEGEVVAIIPNVTWAPKTQVDFLLIVEKLG
jgi:hypothetical protein